MRSLAYGAAILAAAGIMFFITTTSSKPASELPESSPTNTTASIVPDVEVKTASMTMNVPEMHCPFACYPSVKKNLESREDVMSVELAPQKEEGVIDNPQVIVTYREGFDPIGAIALLESVGFAGSSVIEK
jgi:hypothetical protein